MNTTAPLPQWDMTVVYPGLDSEAFAQDFARTLEAITELARLCDAYQIKVSPRTSLTPRTIRIVETVIEHYNRVLEACNTLETYIICFVATNAQDTLAQVKLSELQQAIVILTQLETRFTSWIGSLDAEALIERSRVAERYAFQLRKATTQAAHLMTPAEEDLAAELAGSNGAAWKKLHGALTSQLTVSLELAGEVRQLPMSMVRNLAHQGDRAVRQRAYEAELAGWERVALPLAAALNGIKGEAGVLAKRRGWGSPLEESLFRNAIDRQALDAMLTAAQESFSDFRRYLHTKARALGLPRLAWYDLLAPVGSDETVWDYEEATAWIIEQFGTYSTRLAEFAQRAFREQWIDAEPRTGKRDGANCASLRADESRILVNYHPTFGGVCTLAHELGHGYHNLNLSQRLPLQRTAPDTLAETASIFCETLIRQAALQKAGTQQQITLLEASLQDICGLVVDISSRFLFEQRVFERRTRRELSVDELKTLMREAQQETYGDGLDEAALHPFLWAAKPQYYQPGRSFYNYPYLFGFLFGLGLYARYEQDPEPFKAGYDELLSATGMADAATLAARFALNIRSVEFWRASLDIVRKDIERFEKSVAD